ncbi:MAG: CoA transferase [Chloroflexi bacterium]|nr:CoA transferase [Chloroflexota bacterium]
MVTVKDQEKTPTSSVGLLEPYRVLDLADEKGSLCGRIFASLGADVIKIEKPGGDPARNIGPFYHDIVDPQKSLHWFAYNAGKRSITLDIELAEGQEFFKRLVKTADFVIESSPPGHMDKLGLGYQALSKINPRIIVTSITHFGQTGPYKDYKASDLIHMALSGIMSITGDSARAPLRLGLEQSYNVASLYACVGTLLAHYYRLRSGEGQHVDLSIYESCVRCNQIEPLYWEHSKFISQRFRRFGSYVSRGGLYNRSVWPCKDGHIVWLLFGGVDGARENRPLTGWMDSEGMAGHLKDVKWEEVDLLTCSQKVIDSWEEVIGQFFLRHTKRELQEGAMQKAIRLFPVADIAGAVENEQLASRGFWVKVEHPELQTTINYPGPFYLSNNSACKVKCRAPLVGEHNEEVYEELRLQGQQPSTPKRGNVSGSGKLPLEGVKVLDLTWAAAGPEGTRYLADHGAFVIKVESIKHVDILRVSEPFKDNIVGLDHSLLFSLRNSSKYSISLDLKHPRGIEVAKRLAGWADVVVENFRPGVMERLGLGYEELKKIRPDIIMLRSSIWGQKGAYGSVPAWGFTSEALTGHTHLTGWSDGEPARPGWMLLPDVVIQPMFQVTLVIAALDYRTRTGKGHYIDLAQIEPMAHFVAPALLDYIVNGRQQTRMGNRSPRTAPHGAFLCGKDGKWCAIAVFSEEEWRAFCEVTGHLEWTADPRFATRECRKQNEDELERLVEDWTVSYAAQEVMDRMQAAGVGAAVVQTAGDVVDHDPQLKARQSFIPLEHPVIGICNYATPPFKLSRSLAHIRPAPTFGQHNHYIYKEILGMSDEEIAELVEAGVFE